MNRVYDTLRSKFGGLDLTALKGETAVGSEAGTEMIDGIYDTLRSLKTEMDAMETEVGETDKAMLDGLYDSLRGLGTEMDVPQLVKAAEKAVAESKYVMFQAPEKAVGTNFNADMPGFQAPETGVAFGRDGLGFQEVEQAIGRLISEEVEKAVEEAVGRRMQA